MICCTFICAFFGVFFIRRAFFYELQRLSYRAYLAFKHNLTLPSFSLEDILYHPNQLIKSLPIVSKYPMLIALTIQLKVTS